MNRAKRKKSAPGISAPKKRLDIAIVIPFLEKYGGAERYLIECLRQWQHRHDFTLYSTSINNQLLSEHGILSSVKQMKLATYFEGQHSLLLNALLLPKMWREQIGKHDLYHTHLWPTHLIDLHPMVWFPHEPLRVLHDLRFEQSVEATQQGIAKNIHIYPKYNYDRIGDNFYEACLNTIDVMDKTAKPECIVANSRYTAGYLEEVYDQPVQDVVYPGVEPEAFIDLPMDPNLFVTVSQLWPHKRINLLIEAIAQTDNTQLIIIGSGPEKERLQSIISRLGLDDRVFFLSGLSNKELSLVLGRACAFLFSSIKEPFGIVVLEAMAASKPVIAVNEGGYTEACDPSFSFLVPPYPSAFAEKITFLQQNPHIAKKMGQAGRKIVPNYTWKRAAYQLEKILLKTWETYSSKTPILSNTKKNKVLFGVQYYLWYGEGFGNAHWNDNAQNGYVADRPQLGYYGSTKGQTICYHLDLFERMDLDYVVLNLHIDAHGVNGVELAGIQNVFDIAKKTNSSLKFAIQLAAYTDDQEILSDTVRMIEKIYASRSDYLHLDEAPVLFWFWSGRQDGNKGLIGFLKKLAGRFNNIAISLRLPSELQESRLTFNWFKGFGVFSPLELSGPKNWQKVWLAAYNASRKLGMRYNIATLSPGYDDRALDDEKRAGNPYRYVSRDDGQTYKEGMRFVSNLTIPPDLVMISTFNEYHENTYIEPTLQTGMYYIEATKDFVKAMKKKWGTK